MGRGGYEGDLVSVRDVLQLFGKSIEGGSRLEFGPLSAVELATESNLGGGVVAVAKVPFDLGCSFLGHGPVTYVTSCRLDRVPLSLYHRKTSLKPCPAFAVQLSASRTTVYKAGVSLASWHLAADRRSVVH